MPQWREFKAEAEGAVNGVLWLWAAGWRVPRLAAFIERGDDGASGWDCDGSAIATLVPYPTHCADPEAPAPPVP